MPSRLDWRARAMGVVGFEQRAGFYFIFARIGVDAILSAPRMWEKMASSDVFTREAKKSSGLLSCPTRGWAATSAQLLERVSVPSSCS